MVHVDQLWLDTCLQDRTNWVRDEIITLKDVNNVVNRGTSLNLTEKVTVGVSIECQTVDTEPIVFRRNKNTPRVTVCFLVPMKNPICLEFSLGNQVLESNFQSNINLVCSE